MKFLKEVRMGESGVAYPETRKDDFLVTGDSGISLFLIDLNLFWCWSCHRRCQDLEISER